MTYNGEVCMYTDGAVDPSKIPGATIDVDTMRIEADNLAKHGDSIAVNGKSLNTTWSTLGSSYQAPESAELLTKMTPVETLTADFDADLTIIADAVKSFATEVEPIKAELERLRTEATNFINNKVIPGVSVRRTNPEWTAYNYSVAGSSYYGVTPSTSTDVKPPPMYVNKVVNWKEDPDTVAENNNRLVAVNTAVEQLWAAERNAANKIRALYGAPPLHASTGADDANGYGVDEIPDNAAMPWGGKVDVKETCSEDPVEAVFKDFLWEGVIVDGIWGTVEGLGTLALGYNPETGDFFDGDIWGPSWVGLGSLLGGIALRGGVAGPLFIANDISRMMTGEGFIDGPLGDFAESSGDTLVAAGKGIIAYDMWDEDPARALGGAGLNILSVLIPGGAAIKTSGTLGSVLAKASNVLDFVDPISLAFKGGSGLYNLGADFVTQMKFTDSVLNGKWLDDAGGLPPMTSLDDVTIRMDDGGFKLDNGHGGEVPHTAIDDAVPPRDHTDTSPADTTPGKATDDAAGETTPGKGADDAAGDTTPGKGSDDAAGDTTPGTGSDDAAGDTTPGTGDADGSGGADDAATGDGTTPGGADDGTRAPSQNPKVDTLFTSDGEVKPWADWHAEQKTLGTAQNSANLSKGEYGELVTQAYYESEGYTRIDPGATGGGNVSSNGIDGIFERTNPDTGAKEYVIAESKYNTASPKNTAGYGRQGSSQWILHHLANTPFDDPMLSSTLQGLVMKGDLNGTLVKISPEGVVTTRALDTNGYVK